jgi:hypothetical protein
MPVHAKWIRRLTGVAVLSVAATAFAADAPKAALAPSTAEMAIENDTAHLMKLFELAKTKKKIEGRIKSNALLIATYAQMNLDGPNGDKMAAIRDQALKVAEAAAKKDLAAAEALAKELTTAKGSGDKKPVNLSKAAKVELVEVMDLFGGSIGGGMNIEKDIREAKKNGPKDAKSAELIGARSAALATLYIELMPELGGKKTKDDWIKWSTQARTQAADIAAEAAKGEKADLAKLKKMISSLDATCTTCHNTFRDE